MEKFRHKKSLGQNFLKDEAVLKNIADSIITTNDDLIIEIGPGQGALTKYLVNKDSYLICYEIDTRVEEYLLKYECDKCHVIYTDFLNVNISQTISNIKKYKNIYVVANIPYYITTPILEKIISWEINVEGMVLMVQKEVAQRFSAKPGSKAYGSLTVFINYYYDTEYLFEVKRVAFEPIPNVDSAVVKFVRKKDKLMAINENFLFEFVRTAFQFKRKNLRNNLKKYDLDVIEKILKNYGYDLNSRAEQIPCELFVVLTNELFKHNN